MKWISPSPLSELFYTYIGISLVFSVFGFSSWVFALVALAFVVLIKAQKKNEESQKETVKPTKSVPQAVVRESVTPASYEAELDMAKKVQQGLLSFNPTPPENILIAKKCIPAESVGGDFYTFINKDISALSQRPQRSGVIEYVDSNQTYFGVVMGDVSGHGLSSALVMALSSGIISEIAFSTRSPAETFKKANSNLNKYIENSHISYVTAFYAVINTETKMLTYARAGHPPALLCKGNGQIITLGGEGIFLGMYPDEEYSEETIQLDTGDRLVLYTDGIPETKNNKNEAFGDERLKSLIWSNKLTPIDETMNAIFNDVDTFSGQAPPVDDRTMVILEIG